MANNNQALAVARVNSVSNYFMDKVADCVKMLPDIIGQGEARRLTANLVIKANATLEEDGKSWANVDAAKFMMDAVRMVTLGLDAANSECYPIPYNNNKTKRIDVQCSASAKGMQKLIQQYAIGRKVVDFRAFAIREGDEFKVVRTPGDDLWEFAENVFGEGKVKGYVTIVAYEDGTSQVMTHSLADIAERRKASKAPNSQAWTKWSVEMALAKATRRHCSRIPYKLPDAREKAFNEIEELEREQEERDITPATIELSDVASLSSSNRPTEESLCDEDDQRTDEENHVEGFPFDFSDEYSAEVPF